MGQGDLIRLNVLGGLETLGPDGRPLRFPTRHCGFVLAMLAVAPDCRMRRETIAGHLWGERGESQARASLRQTVHHLQKTLHNTGCPALDVERDVLALQPARLSCDLWDLKQALHSNREAIGDLYKGPFLASTGRTDPAFDEWISEVRDGLERDVGTALRSLATDLQIAGRHSELERMAGLLLTLDPYDEAALRLRMEALAGQGRNNALRATFADFSARIRTELDTQPSAETAAWLEILLAEPDQPNVTSQPEEPPQSDGHHEIRQTVSVLSVLPDIDDVDPETIRDAVARARMSIEAAVQPAEAELLTNAGDTIDVVFGGGGRSEGHAEDAVRSAWHLATTDAGPFRGLGVVTGGIIISEAGAEPASVGALVARAAQLARRGNGTKVSVAAETADRADGFFEFEPLPDTGGYAVTGETPARNRWQARRDASRGNFIARSSELAELERAADRAAGGSGRVVGIVGEAGIGKSRLVAEFLKHRAAKPFRVLTLAAAAHDMTTPFGPLRDFLAEWAGRPMSQAGLADALLESAGREGLAAEHFPALLALAGVAQPNGEWERWDGPRRRRRIVALVRAIVECTCRQAPLVLVAEDLHWLDGETEHLLHTLIDDLATQPLLLLATYRPEYAAGFVGRSVFHLIRLEPLSGKETADLVAELIGSDPALADVRQRIATRTGGIPLFIEESISALAGSGVLAGEPGRYETGKADETAALPATIQDVLSARLAQLSGEARWLIQCASVFGPEAEKSQLLSCGGLGADRTDGALRELLQAELLMLKHSRGGDVLRFRHALIEDVSYSSLLSADRRRLHGDIYRLLTAGDPPVSRERCNALARHADRHGDQRAAAQWHERAGDLFADISAYAQAADAFQQALDAIAASAQPDRSAELNVRLKLRPVLVPLGRFGAAIEQLEAAEDLLAGQSDRLRSASILISKSYIHSTNGQLSDAVEEARRAAALTRKGEQPAFEARLAQGQALSLSGAWQETLSVLQPTVEFWEDNRQERFGHTGTRSVWCHGHLAHAHTIHGDFEAAKPHADRASQIAIETGRPLDRVFADHRRGEILLTSGRFEDAIALFENAFAVADSEAEDAPIFRTWFACDLAPAYLAAGRLDDAARILAVQHENARRMELRQFGAWIVLRKAELALAERDFEAAAALAAQASELARQVSDLLLEPVAMRVCGIAQRVLDIGGTCLEDAAALCRRRGFEPELAACRSALATSDRP